MFKAHQEHLQAPLFSSVNQLSEKIRQRLEQSWASEFYNQFFCRLVEKPFAVLYDDHPSRPNIPVNVLVALDVLKAGFGWSDEEVYDHFLFDLQVRYALGYQDLHEGEFDLRTLYNFRRRLSQYNLEHGVNLLSQAFAAITDQQVIAFKVRTDLQRMDSTQVASNILDSSRLQLAAEAVQRAYRLLSEEDQARYALLLAPYLKDTTNQYVYRIKGKAQVREHLTQIGQVLHQLVQELKAAYADDPFFPVLERFFSENFRVEAEAAQPKADKELTSGCLQSLDDLEASYRQKGNCFYKGYVANLSETCHPENEVQLITLVQAAPNNVDDPQLLQEALPELVERTDLKTLYTDGGYGSPAVDQDLHQHQVELVQTAIRGTRLSSPKLHLSEFAIDQDEDGAPLRITCPHQQTVAVGLTRSGKGFVAQFDPQGCENCPFHQQERCRAQLRQKSGKYHLDFNQQEVDAAQRRRRCIQNKQADHNLRAAIEATVRSVKHPFPDSKLPVRGLFRITVMLVAAAAMANIRSIWRYRKAQRKEQTGSETAPKPEKERRIEGQTGKAAAPKPEKGGMVSADSPLGRLLRDVRGAFLHRFSLSLAYVGC